jgi:hypothetical protein
MRKHIQIAAITAVAGACIPAMAQDSVSINGGGLPGDALDPWSQQCDAFVVDLSPIVSTQGHLFGVAPILKTNAYDAGFFNNLPSTSTISPDVALGVQYARPSYSFWNTPGAGINGEFNSQGQAVSPDGLSTRFAVAQGSFGGPVGDNFTGVVAAYVNFDPADANRLYVDRNQAAVNRDSILGGASSTIGGYSIDASGNLYYRADGSGTAGSVAPNPIPPAPNFNTSNVNWYRSTALSAS